MGHFEANFRLKGYASSNIYELLDGEWLFYNFAAERFYTKNFVADFIPLKLIFIQNKKKQNDFLSDPLGDAWVTYTLHL